MNEEGPDALPGMSQESWFCSKKRPVETTGLFGSLELMRYAAWLSPFCVSAVAGST